MAADGDGDYVPSSGDEGRAGGQGDDDDDEDGPRTGKRPATRSKAQRTIQVRGGVGGDACWLLLSVTIQVLQWFSGLWTPQ